MAVLPGLSRDTATLKRPGAAVDAEGNPTNALSTIAAVEGTWGRPSHRDHLVAGQRSQTLDAVFATASEAAQLGDVLNVRGNDYEVVAIADARFHQRLFLRRSD